MMEFHISRSARERYQFAESLFSFNGNVVFANMAGLPRVCPAHEPGARR